MKSKIMSVNQNNGKNDKGKICLIDILSWKQVLGTKVFGFLLLCSFAVVLAACGGVEVTAIEPFGDIDKDGVIDSRDSCPELANEGIDTDGDGIDDVCDTDDDGDGVVDEKDNCPKISNPLQGDVCEDDTSPAQGCTTQVRNFCELAEADYGSNRVGTCEDTYAGECAYTCNDDGEWEKLVNSCLADGVDDNGNPITVCKGYELVPDGGGDTITLTENWIIVGDFTATFDGNGNTIKNLTIVGTATGANDETLGFFTSSQTSPCRGLDIFGQLSFSSTTSSPSSSVSQTSSIPSSSVSIPSFASSGQLSLESMTPSLSVSSKGSIAVTSTPPHAARTTAKLQSKRNPNTLVPNTCFHESMSIRHIFPLSFFPLF